jgi:acyl carrier protein
MPETDSGNGSGGASREALEARVIDALVEFGEEREGLTAQSRFADLDVDSLDLVELAQIIEDEYEIEVQDSDLDKIETVNDVVELVSARLSA